MVAKRRLRGSEPFGAAPAAAVPDCPLCGRAIAPGPSADQHHLLPRSEGGRTEPGNLALLHRICHRKIHATFSERELAGERRDWTALRAHPEIAAFVHWLRGKPPDFYDRNRTPRRRR